MPLVMGVDSSTQACKVLIADALTGAVLRIGRAAHPADREIDPEHWWEALQAAIAEAGGIADVAAWSIAAQQHGLVALDRQGRVIRPASLWHDTRPASAAQALIAEVGAGPFARRTGLVPVASFTVSKLRWLRDEEPRNAARVAAVALPHDWLTWRLRGFGPENPDLDELATDRSDASGTGYWGAAGYDHGLLALALGHDALLPRVLGPREHVADTAGRLVGAGAGDNAAAALGLGARAGAAIVSIGTSGTICAISPETVADPAGIVAGFADANGQWLPLVATLNAARVLDTTARLLGVGHSEFDDLALAAQPGSGGLTLTPYFEGERTPNLPQATASLSGMTLTSTTRQNLARAAVEGMLSGLRHGLDAIRDLGVPIRHALLIGGGSQSAAVRTIAPGILGTRITAPPPAEYAALGAARQAARLFAAGGEWAECPTS